MAVSKEGDWHGWWMAGGQGAAVGDQLAVEEEASGDFPAVVET